jgi:hypothetical protein
MIEKSFQPSAFSSQFFPTVQAARCSAKDASLLPTATQPEVANIQAGHCRIVCDETADDFRRTLCRTFCAGICPEHDRNRAGDESSRLSVALPAAFGLKTES